MKRLKILWLSHLVPYPPRGGVQMRAFHLLREVSRYHDVDLFALVQPRALRSYYPSVDEGLGAARVALATHLQHQEYHPLPSEASAAGRYATAFKSLLTPTPYSVNWLVSARADRAFAWRIATGDYDLIHFDTIGLAPYRAHAGTIPTVLDHHNIESHMMLRRIAHEPNIARKAYYWQEGHKLERYERRMLRRFTHHIVCSEVDRERLLEIDSSIAVSVIENGIEFAAREISRAPADPPRLLFIGGLDWYPNREAVEHFLADIWPPLVSRLPTLSIDIVGKNPSDRIRTLATHDPRIRIHGFVDDITGFYREAALFICPIRDGGGTKLKVLDAMAHKVPTVSYSAGAEGLAIESGRHAVIAKNSSEMTDCIVSLAGDPHRARQIGYEGYNLVRQRYDFEAIGKKLAKIYSSTSNECEQACSNR